MARVLLDSVRKVYPGGHEAVHGASLEVEDGELVVFVGPSGCGKSSLLRMIAGLEEVTGGTLSIGDRVVAGGEGEMAPKDRDVAMVFQNYALYPHMTVRQNLGFGLEMRKVPKGQIAESVDEAAGLLGLGDVLDRKPAQLSGGQRQRVALGRAIVRRPAVFLFDEPLSNLDAKLRVQMRTEIAGLHRKLGATMIYVTHDQVEAMTMGDRIVVLRDGHIQQVAPPLTLYDRPANEFVASFIGSPAMSLFRGVVSDDGQRFVSDGGAFTLDLDGATAERLRTHWGAAVTLGIRPEHLYVERAERATVPSAPTRWVLDVCEPMGHEVVVYAHIGAVDESVRVVARVAPQPLPTPGEALDLVMDLSKLHAFDPATGRSLSASRGGPASRTEGGGPRAIAG